MKQINIPLYCMGIKTENIYKYKQEGQKNFKVVLSKFDTHFTLNRNVYKWDT